MPTICRWCVISPDHGGDVSRSPGQEEGPADQVYFEPRHPYTRLLVASIRNLTRGSRRPACMNRSWAIFHHRSTCRRAVALQAAVRT
ncbi:MAG: hypothetical protein IPF49_00040 [Gammaproteobacteria bacterium]|nr:hypothetical protein [Gammaproteobacteria bacterium]